jgi:hypothetical protein
MIKKKAPHVKWIISFADGTQCGDGTIYSASNFVLTGINKNHTIIQMPDGSKIAGLTLDIQGSDTKRRYDRMCGLDPAMAHTRKDYLMGGGKNVGRIPAPLRLFSRQIIPQAADGSRAAIFGNR